MTPPRPTFADDVLASLRDFDARARSGEPIRQAVVRRLVVKGKVVHTRETFAAPMRRLDGK